VALGGLLCLNLALRIDVEPDPLFARVAWLSRLVWEGAHSYNPERVRALANVCNAYSIDETGKRLLEDVFDHLRVQSTSVKEKYRTV
jgi:hypothetical protein